MINKKGQVTVFIIIAILLIIVITGFFLLRNKISTSEIPVNLEPVYTTFLSCLEDDALVGIDILETQGGYIEIPSFEEGSSYMPFSSQLNFLGNPIPYWYYVSGNNIQKEQIPSKTEMEKELGNFIQGKIRNCNFDSYYDAGFYISIGEPKVSVTINKNNVEISLNIDLGIEKGEESVMVKNSELTLDSNLGNLYDSALDIYDAEQNELFLEKYGVDILRLYAPVDGVETSCSPEIWNADDIFDELEKAIESNTLALKVEGGDYILQNKEDDYFVINLDVDGNVRFLNSQNWPNSFEVAPAEGNILMANPVGNQPGLGILGFCYAPYHFVYDMKYPVLVQIEKGEETFQFPLAVVIQGNVPREPLEGNAATLEIPGLCGKKNTLVNVQTYDLNLNSVDADISYECSGTSCFIGKASEGVLISEFPQCANGVVTARAEGYEDAETIFSTINSGNIDLILNKLYEMQIDLNLDSKDYNGEAIITFVSEASTKTVVYPSQKTVELSEGQYEVQVYVYKNSSLKIAESTSKYCADVPKSGLGGLFGLTEEECFDVTLPEQIISNALAGGGKENYYLLESELKGNSIIEINAESLPTPDSLDDLSQNYILFENKGLGIYFK